MSTGTRGALEEANLVAVALASTLGPGVRRIEVAGSIRRGRPDVGDIELVAVPKIETVSDGMFAERQVNWLTLRVDLMIRSGILAPHPTDPKRGERYSKLLEPTTGLQLDLFSASAGTFGIILLIRTGPADYSRRFVDDLRGRGLHAAEGQLHRGGLGCRLGGQDGKAILCDVVPTPEEADVYAAAAWPFVPPEDRR